MPRRKRTQDSTSFVENITTNHQKRKKSITFDFLLNIEPLTDNQRRLFDSYQNGKHIVAYGSSGSGKTFISLYNALKDVLNDVTPYENIYIVRSLVQTREIGFMPGDESAKQGYFEIPYKNMVRYMFQLPSDSDFEMLYDALKLQKTIKFYNTSFIRGLTLDNCVIIVDEMQNLSFHELCSIITRVGENTKIIFSGDASQSDLIKTNEKNGIHDFIRILRTMPSFDLIEFNVNDICRSGLVKEFLIHKEELGL
jgi:predicted ribonuclease YlaK